MTQTPQPTHSPADMALGVLVVAADSRLRARLAAHVWQALPAAQVYELAHMDDLVYRVAGNRVGLVVVEASQLQPQPLTPLLVQMLKGIQPALRIVSVAQTETLSAPATDATLTETGLNEWLRTVYGSSSASTTPLPTTSPTQPRPD